MTYKLRDYQQKASDTAVAFFNDKKAKYNAIMVLPTGSGKSLVIADIANRLQGHTLVFQPSKEILEQNYKKLCSYGVLDCSVYSASFNSKNISRITFATIGSVIRHTDDFQHFNNVIIDECHFVNAKGGMYEEFIHATGCKVLGLKFKQLWRNAKVPYSYPSNDIFKGYLSSANIDFTRYGLSFKDRLLPNEPIRVG